MFNIEKYRVYDYIQLVGTLADVETENEQGELINYICTKDCSFIKKTAVFTTGFDAQSFVMAVLDEWFSVSGDDVCIIDDRLDLCVREDENGYQSENGLYFTTYRLKLLINGIVVESDDLHELLPGFDYCG